MRHIPLELMLYLLEFSIRVTFLKSEFTFKNLSAMKKNANTFPNLTNSTLCPIFFIFQSTSGHGQNLIIILNTLKGDVPGRLVCRSQNIYSFNTVPNRGSLSGSYSNYTQSCSSSSYRRLSFAQAFIFSRMLFSATPALCISIFM